LDNRVHAFQAHRRAYGDTTPNQRLDVLKFDTEYGDGTGGAAD
jgi:hypothetical protein